MSNLEQKLVSLVLEVADENPEYVYNPTGKSTGCHYTRGYGDPNEPSINAECTGCIIGRALQRLGVDKEFLENKGNFDWYFAESVVEHLHEKKMYEDEYLSYSTVKALRDCQEMQDSGQMWGKCVIELKELMPTT